MTTFIREFDCHGFTMQTEVNLSAKAKRLVRFDADGTANAGEWQRLPASANINERKLVNAGYRLA